MRSWHTLGAVLLLLLVSAPRAAQAKGTDYKKDVASACDQIERECRVLLKSKEIDWKKVRRAMLKDVKKVKTHEQHYALLLRLIGRLQDGHAGVLKTALSKDVKHPRAGTEWKGPGLFWCRSGKRYYVRSSWSSAKDLGVVAGMEIVKVDGLPAQKWLDARIEQLSDVDSFSTRHHAEHYAFHAGLAEPRGTRVDYLFKDLEGKTRKRTLVCERAIGPWGPAFAPKGLQGKQDVAYGKTAKGYGYIHYRRSKSSIPYRTDDALQALGPVKGMILDFRANSGGSFGHEDLLGRFIPEGKKLTFAKTHTSRGGFHYGGPIVVIVNGMTVSAGETGSGMFKEEGRAYMIGESPTAGMSSSKRELDLPSGLFKLYVSVSSNMGRYNKGRGVEGIGIIPHEIVDLDPKDLAAERDTLIERAEAIFAAWPKDKVPYKPERFGWKAP